MPRGVWVINVLGDSDRIEFSADVVCARLLRDAVSEYLKNWPGGPPEEQTTLQHIKTELDRGILELLLGDQ